MRATAARILNWLEATAACCFGLCFRFASRWVFVMGGILGLLLAWGNWQRVIPPSPVASWSDSPAVYLGAAVLFWSLEAMQSWSRTRRCRTPSPEQIEARYREIESWLKRPIAGEDDLSALVEAEDGESNAMNDETVRGVLEWAQGRNAELWYYTTSSERWDHLCGECGVALVHEGKVIDFSMWSMN